MSQRTIVIFGLFLVISIVGGIFIYFYQGYAEQLISRYVSKITVCENISNEEVCYAKEFCEGIYGPTCPDCNDSAFRRCQRIPLNVLAKTEQSKSLCTKTGGEWFHGKMGDFCVCQEIGVNKVFDAAQGCINK
ncbi:MAG: hypothetical protein HUU49_03930 [Candidatus Buchananbacteria bacterium]|nr:hypothetical protein [Candidatus Buchananbacteria bacterium]